MRVCVLLVTLVAGSLAYEEPLTPPTTRLENSEAIVPLVARKKPTEGKEFAEPNNPSPSNKPRPIPVDTTHTEVGNSIEHRQFLDYPEDLQLVMPGSRFPGSGNIKKWELFAGRDCKLEVQVFRPAPTPLALDQNKEAVHSYTLVGSNVLDIPEYGEYEFEVPEASQIQVERGDVLGLHTTQPGCVTWSSGGSTTLYRYGYPKHTELKLLESVVFIGDGLIRTYSVKAWGNFSYSPSEMDKRWSPSGSPSLSPSNIPSPTPTISPSQSTSVSSIATASPSITPSTSFEGPTPSHTPSVSPTWFDRSSECAKGISFWCASEHNMHMCNVTAEICDIVMDALHPPLPSPYPSETATVTPSVSFSPTLALSSEVRPSPTPSTSYVPAPYLVDPNDALGSNDTMAPGGNGAGLTNCHYCNGGQDWSGGQCISGREQSPITLSFDSESLQVDPNLDLYYSVKYNYTRAVLHWDDYSFTLLSNGFGLVNVDGKNYIAEKVVIRAPSEHRIEGFRTPMEMQIFHRLEGSNPPVILAVAVLFEETAHEVKNLDWIYQIPKDKRDMPVIIDLESFFEDLHPLAFYNGSLTQPPCSEGIQWAVSLGASARVSYSQMQVLNSFLKNNRAFAAGRGNNRMLQALHDRKVVLRSNCGTSGASSCGRGKGAGSAKASDLPASQGGSAEAVEAAHKILANDALAKAAQPQPVEDVDDGMFDDGDVKLW